MKKSMVARFLVAAVTLPAIGLSVASPASADGYIQWKQKSSGKCLSYARDDGYVTIESCDNKNTTRWFDSQGSDTNYAEFAVGRGSQCLDSNTSGSVYLSGCESGNNYQSWSEEKWNGGWVLKNVATGRCLGAKDYDDHRAFTGDCSANFGKYWE